MDPYSRELKKAYDELDAVRYMIYDLLSGLDNATNMIGDSSFSELMLKIMDMNETVMKITEKINLLHEFSYMLDERKDIDTD